MGNKLKENLLAFKRITITIDELEEISPNLNSYETFATTIIELEEANILQMVKSKGRNLRTPSLAYRYRINKHLLNHTHYQRLQAYRLKFHEAINLDDYFHLSHDVWLKDLPYLEKINAYIEQNGFPVDKEPGPRRSFELVGDEKWIEENGLDILHRIKLWTKMNIFPVSDPLMFAVNPTRENENSHLHLIVENKTTYQALLPVLTETVFSTLIYGSGNKVTKSIENFSNQYPVGGNHTFFYFGDIDQSGITIWYSLQQREQRTVPALSFYDACLNKERAYGKTNQRPNKKALEKFLSYFTKSKAQHIHNLLDRGAYYPQEVLETKELQKIWLETDWYMTLDRLAKTNKIV